MADPITGSQSSPGMVVLQRWRDAIVSTPETTSLPELGVIGLLLSRELHREAEPTRVQLIERVVRATQEPVYGVRYATRSELLQDIDALLQYREIPESRTAVGDRLAEIVRSARDGRGASLVVAGESGIGKTFLWDAFRRSFSSPDNLWVYHKSPQTGESPYGAYSEILDGLIRRTAHSLRITPVELAFRLVRDDQVAAAAMTVLSSLFPQRYSAVATVYSADDAFEGAVVAALAATLRNVGTRARSAGFAAVVVALDDVQWTDAHSLDAWSVLAGDPGTTGILLMARPGLIESVPALHTVPAVSMGPLSAAEARTLARALIVPAGDRVPSWSTGTPADIAEGNAFHIAQTARETLQIRGLGAPGSRGLLEVRSEKAVLPHLRGLSSAAQAVIESVSLLLPPVATHLITQAVRLSPEEVNRALRESSDAGVLVVRDETVAFFHDQLESAARSAAFHRGRWTADAGRVLAERAVGGDFRATYFLARLIADSRAASDAGDGNGLPLEAFLSNSECVAILSTAARRAIDLAIAFDAARFVAVALDRYGATCGTSDRVALVQIGHRAAFLQDDGHGMSHYYRELARYGLGQDVVDARQLWISRCYTKLWIRGALRIGKSILRDYGATEGLTVESARTLLRSWRPSALYRRIMRHPQNVDPISLRIARTCAGLLLTVMSIDHDAPYIFAAVILRQGIARGPTSYTPFGFLYWAIAVSLDSGTSRRRDRALECARYGVQEISLDSVSAVEANRIRVLVGIITLPWERLQPAAYRHLLPLYREGLACGSFEAAAHAIHVYCYAPLFHGYPLSEVYSTIEHYRRDVTSHGLERISRAMGKFAQAALVLAGETDRPLEVTGHICTDGEMEGELSRTGDTLGLAGLRFLRALLAVFHGSPELALDRLRVVDRESVVVRFLVDKTWSWFLHAMFAWRLGAVDEARTYGRYLRTVAGDAPGNHRNAAVRAERLLHFGLHRIADRTFRYAAELAVANGHIHDAAFIVERHAEILLGRVPDSPATIERLHMAESLYARWGARRKVEKIRSHIDRYRNRAGQILEGVVPDGDVLRDDGVDDDDDVGDKDDSDDDQDAITGGNGSAELTAAREALTHTQEYARILFSYVDEALLLSRSDGSVLFHNIGAAPFLVTESPDVWHVEPELHRRIGGIRGGVEGEVEWRHRTLSYAMRSVPGSQDFAAVAVVIRDITKERSRERQLLVADRLSSLGMLAATVAHEVGNPNHIIALHAQTLAAGEPTPAVQEAATAILEGAQRINDVVRLIARYGRDGTQVVAQWGDPIEIGSRVERFTRILARQYTAHLEFVHGESVPAFWGYPALVEQALVNLVKNACEALTTREQKVRIQIGHHEGFVLFQVRDQGAGFTERSPDGRNPGATPFVTTKTESGGTGLGISVVRSVADRHRGSLRYTHTNEFTTIAELRIPIESS
ncbi:MAG: AAA family ATPase [Alkalispirochaeta sp.]